jgi:hypothetical protein
MAQKSHADALNMVQTEDFLPHLTPVSQSTVLLTPEKDNKVPLQISKSNLLSSICQTAQAAHSAEDRMGPVFAAGAGKFSKQPV